jgi:sortase (surface protein transpeptidase)
MPEITSQPDPPAWDVDADWWGPSWDVVTSAGTADAARPSTPRGVTASAPSSASPAFSASPASTVPPASTASKVPPGSSASSASPASPAPSAPLASPASSVADRAVAVPAAPGTAAADPSWGRILATTISLWVSRRSGDVRRGSLARRPGPSDNASGALARRPGPSDDLPGALFRRPRVAVRASAFWLAHARFLSAAMLGAGLLAAGAGAVGLVMAHTSSAPPVRLAARPSPVSVPSGRTLVPVSLSTVQQTPRPVSLTIPAIGVKAPIVTLGLNRNGTLQVPGSTKVVGWYTGSPRPGAIGSAVIAGHVDSRSGPGVFYWLRRMHRGERIYVRRADGTLAVFTVTAVKMYAKARFPTAAVYGAVPDAELRLITCGGTFDYAHHSYLSNVVVYARLSG